MKGRTVLGVVVCVVVGAFGMFLIMSGPLAVVKAECPGPEGTPCGNGDVNGSGTIDMADPIYMLAYLFANGPEIVPMESAYSRYTDTGEGTVIDLETGLEWLKATADTNGDELVTNADRLSQQGAMAYCWNLSLAGHSDWRLPSDRELLTLVVLDNDPTIDGIFSAEPSGYWTSGAYPDGKGVQIDFATGGGFVYTSTSGGYVRAVRRAYPACDSCCPQCPACDSCCPPSQLPATGQTRCYMGASPYEEIDCTSAEYPGQDAFSQKGCPMEERFVDNEDGTVTDNCTGLTWQQATAADTYTWAEALQYCKDLEFGGETDWRLPNVRELQSIVDYGRYAPAIDPMFSAESSWYWSSSSSVGRTGNVWLVNFSLGIVADGAKDVHYYVRAVRG